MHCLFIFVYRVSLGVTVNVLFTYSGEQCQCIIHISMNKSSIDIFNDSNAIEIIYCEPVYDNVSFAEPLNRFAFHKMVQQIMSEGLYFRNLNK